MAKWWIDSLPMVLPVLEASGNKGFCLAWVDIKMLKENVVLGIMGILNQMNEYNGMIKSMKGGYNE